MNITELDRNDLEGAERYYRANRPISPLEWRVLAKLQDDPVEFYKMSVDWDIVSLPT